MKVRIKHYPRKGQNMLKRCHKVKFFLLLIPALLIFNCSLKYQPQTGEEFSREIIRLEKLTKENVNPPVRAKSHLQLAWLYAHNKSPQLDYGKALQEFEAYAALTPAEAKSDEIQNWVAVLRELQRREKETAGLRGENTQKGQALERMQTRLESLEKTNRSLNETNRGLKDSNEKMGETIEKLKKLDRQMEERRRRVK